jgi:VWFA-related protein
MEVLHSLHRRFSSVPSFRFRYLRYSAILAKLVAACSLSAGLPIAQCQTDDRAAAGIQLKLEGNLVVVQVVVRDLQGRPVKGLRKEDFKVYDRGKEQPITQFEEESTDQAPSGPANAIPERAASLPKTVQPDRFIAFYFDDLNTSDADMMQARDAADPYLAANLQPKDRVAIFTSRKMLSDFTSDPKHVHDALFQLHSSSAAMNRAHECPNLSDYQAMEIMQTNDQDSNAWKAAWAETKTCAVKSFVSSQDSNAPKPDGRSMVAIRMLAQRVVDRAEAMVRANLEQFEKVVEGTAQMPGQRTVILVSPGFLSESEQLQLDRIIDHALRSQVVINSLDPKGLAVLMREADASRSSAALPDSHATQARHTLEAESGLRSSDVLAEVAQDTGGEFFHDDNNLRAGFGELAGHPEHYVLTFAPRDMNRDGKFHAIKVSLAEKRKGYSIQARRGYFGSGDPAETTEQASESQSKGETRVENEQPAVPASLAKVAPENPEAPGAKASIPGLDMRPKEGQAEASKASSATHLDAKPPHPRKGSNRLTVDQLEQILAADADKSDMEVALQLSESEMTERINKEKLAHWMASLPGIQGRDSLAALADESEFLSPPAAEIPPTPVPEFDTQIQLLKLAVSYAAQTLTRLPNFFATRDTTLFADMPARRDGGTFGAYKPLHRVGQFGTTVLYRNGKEVVDSGGIKNRISEPSEQGLITSGEFGPILGTVLADAAQGHLTWNRWERDAAGPVAVYRYAVPKPKSHYQVKFCCVPQGSGFGVFQQLSGYHGEIAIDAASGTILRLTLQADMKPDYPLAKADMLVEYGSVEIGGKTYICPIKSVAIAIGHVQTSPSNAETPHFRGMLSEETNAEATPLQTLLNHVTFGQYHMFRSDTRILTSGSSDSEN